MHFDWVDLDMISFFFSVKVSFLGKITSNHFASLGYELSQFASVQDWRWKLDWVGNVEIHVAEFIAE